MSLPVAGTFTAPAKGSLRSDAVLIAPEDEMPVLVVEVDNHTEPAEVVAQKIVGDRAFFRRQVKDHRGRDIPLWTTLWDESGRGGYPPVALVFTKDVGPEARMRRMKKIKEASRACWEGHWHTDTGWQPPVDGEQQGGWWDYTDTVPVIATHLEHLRAKGPHGPIWWRFGRSNWQPLTDALTNTRTKAEYDAREAVESRGWHDEVWSDPPDAELANVPFPEFIRNQTLRQISTRTLPRRATRPLRPRRRRTPRSRCGTSITARPASCSGTGRAEARSSAICPVIRSRTRSATASWSRSARTSVSCSASRSSSSSSSARRAGVSRRLGRGLLGRPRIVGAPRRHHNGAGGLRPSAAG
ncbi:hypothetical protein ACTMTU_34385 [Streptomyces sp. OZ13]|uniref:hypothetical protein n=1 Tax=Streptomyces sp. OZ13 TaxID=3452210 RepID=UPI003F8A75F0